MLTQKPFTRLCCRAHRIFPIVIGRCCLPLQQQKQYQFRRLHGRTIHNSPIITNQNAQVSHKLQLFQQYRYFKELGSIPPPPPSGPSAALARSYRSPSTFSLPSEFTAPAASNYSSSPSYTSFPTRVSRPTPNFAPRQYNAVSSMEATFHIQDMVPVVPTFFVPVEELLQLMPGYTTDHIETYFKETHQFESITYRGVHMLRMHGFLGHNDMSDSVTANDRFRQYEPQIQLADEWGKLLEGADGLWIPIEQLLERASPELKAQCFPGGKTWKTGLSATAAHADNQPVKGGRNAGLTEDLALFYFAQMQHKFCFDPRHEPYGAVQWIPPGAIRPRLDHNQSPCPLVFNELARSTKFDYIEASLAHRRLDREAKLQLKHSFKSWKDFIDHHPYFTIDDAGFIYCRRMKERVDLKNQPLEVQIAHAAKSPDKRGLRALRRRQAKESNPNNPLLNKAFLLDTIQAYLPADRPIKMKDLIASLPTEVTDVLPTMHTKFFSSARCMSFFEMYRANNFFIQRAGIPLPSGALRQEFTEYEIVRLCAEWLQRWPHRNMAKAVILGLPFGARRQVQKAAGGLVPILEKYPESFSIVKVANDEFGLAARLKLRAMPMRPPDYEDDGLFDGHRNIFATEGDGDGDYCGPSFHTSRHRDSLQMRGGGVIPPAPKGPIERY